MWIDPRRSGGALWVLWCAGGALGGGLATSLAIAWLSSIVNGAADPQAFPYDLRVLAYFGTLAAIAALFQSLLLAFVVSRKRAALLWLLATAIGASLFYRLFRDLVFNANLPGLFAFLPSSAAAAVLGGVFQATYALGVGLAQGLVLALITGRKSALAVWIVGTLIALPVPAYLYPHVYVGPAGSGASFIASNAISTGAAAAVTGLALLVILRLGRRDRGPVAPREAGLLQSQG